MSQKFDRRADGKWLLRVALVVLALLFGGTKAYAHPDPYEYLFQIYFDSVYENPTGSYVFGSRLDSCLLCHTDAVPDTNSGELNGFGLDFADPAIGNLTFNSTLDGQDSDLDEFTNLEEILARTFPGDGTDRPVSISGPATVTEGTQAAYEATAMLPDGTTTTVIDSWSVSPDTGASITSTGVLTAPQVTSDQVITVSATYNGLTASQSVTIVDVPVQPSGTITLTPADGAVEVPVNTEIIATLDGSGDISLLVNDSTFSLAVTESGVVVAGEIHYNDSHTAVFLPTVNLANATTYTASVLSGAGTQLNAFEAPMSSTFTTIAQCPDTDGDGVEDCQDDHPNNNGKGSPPSVTGSGKILVELYGNAGIGLRNAQGISVWSPQLNRQGKPFNFTFLDGLVQYQVEGVTPGGTATASVSFPSGIPSGSRLYKVDRNGFQEWTNANVSGNRVTLILTDGGDGDADGTVNGVIVDPLGVAVPNDAAGSSDPVSAAGGGGCSVAGTDGGWSGSAGSIGLIAIVFLGLSLRRRKQGSGA